MAFVDLPLRDLQAYRYPRPAPSGLRQFWDGTLAEAMAAARPPVVAPTDSGITALEVSDITFTGFAGEPVRAWWLRPTGNVDHRPAVVEFLGYGGGRGRPHERMFWAAHGYHHLVVDSRGQGSIWNRGDTPDPHGSAPASPGFLTRGVDDPRNLYYRRLFTDAALAIEAAAQLPGVDPDRIAAVGHSQGGAMALAAAALSGRVAACAARTPFLCGIARNIEVTDNEPYAELRRYLGVHRTDTALGVLDHVDCALLAPWIESPTWISVALMDAVCPPSGIYAAINNFPSPPTVQLWPYNGHEAGGPVDDELIAGWLADQGLGPEPARSTHRSPPPGTDRDPEPLSDKDCV